MGLRPLLRPLASPRTTPLAPVATLRDPSPAFTKPEPCPQRAVRYPSGYAGLLPRPANRRVSKPKVPYPPVTSRSSSPGQAPVEERATSQCDSPWQDLRVSAHGPREPRCGDAGRNRDARLFPKVVRSRKTARGETSGVAGGGWKGVLRGAASPKQHPPSPVWKTQH